MQTFNQDPNFSIVMPGGCNAECKFCFNKDKEQKTSQCSKGRYLINLWETLKGLPDQFYQISITGNEPMLSPMIDDVLEVCSLLKAKYTNILLTTNGTNLLRHIQNVINGVHHINVSRHHYDFEQNKSIFEGTWDVTDEELEEIIDVYSKNGVDVSLNCVINDSTTKEFIDEYIDYAKRIGVYAVRFRKENGKLDMTPVERQYSQKYPILWHGSCPVCRTDLRVIRGLNTYWKSSVLEPSEIITDKVYELVFDTDGKTYLDWGGKNPFLGFKLPKRVPELQSRVVVSVSCGGRNSRDNSC